MIHEDIIVTELIKMDIKQTSLSIGQACQPINSGAKMSLLASLKSAVVPLPAPPVCEGLHADPPVPVCTLLCLVPQTV